MVKLRACFDRVPDSAFSVGASFLFRLSWRCCPPCEFVFPSLIHSDNPSLTSYSMVSVYLHYPLNSYRVLQYKSISFVVAAEGFPNFKNLINHSNIFINLGVKCNNHYVCPSVYHVICQDVQRLPAGPLAIRFYIHRYHIIRCRASLLYLQYNVYCGIKP